MRGGLVLDDRYELDQPLGRGGMGEVWRAYDQKLDRKVAIKFVIFRGGPSEEQLRGRFEQEARNTAWFEHPGVPAVYGLGEYVNERTEVHPYLVMQFVDGVTVSSLIDEGGLPVGWAALIAAQTCAVLGVAHQRPLVHRDLKPGNLMVCPDGSVKVLDFGLSVGLAPHDERLTLTGLGGPGTPGYCAPEQLYGNPVPQSDLYSLGCVLYEMLTGRKVFPGDNSYAISRAHEESDPEPPGMLNADIPRELEDLILHLLAKVPEDRPADAVEVYRRLLPFVTGLGPLADVVAAQTGPSRLYNEVVASIRLDGPPVDAAPARERRASLPSHAEVREAREQVTRLAGQRRYAQAADRLSRLVEPAVLALGEDDREVLELRVALADALYDGGDHRRAIVALRTAARALAEWHGPDDARVRRCREREAECLAKVGDTARALRLLDTLIKQWPVDGDRRRLLSLRERAGRLKLTVGRAEEGRRELAKVADELAGLVGDTHLDVLELRALLG